jgi:hypothetical protein
MQVPQGTIRWRNSFAVACLSNRNILPAFSLVYLKKIIIKNNNNIIIINNNNNIIKIIII